MENAPALTVVIAHPGRDTASKTASAAARAGFRVLEAASGLSEAVSLLKSKRPDLLIAHILLPGLTETFFRENREFLSLYKRPGIVYAYPSGANARMKEGYSPLIPAVPSENDLKNALAACYPPKAQETELLRARKVLSHLGIEDGRAMDYLVFAAGLCLVNAENAAKLTRRIFPEITRTFGVSQKQAESAMQRAVEKAFLSGDIETQYALFGNTIDDARGKPTLSALFARVCEILRLTEDEQLCGRTFV